MAINILSKARSVIPSSFVVRALATNGPRYYCADCGEMMFVRYTSGLCPLCFNAADPWHGAPACEVPHALALAGVLDDPILEGDEAHAIA